MDYYRHKITGRTVKAVQITAQTFDAPHLNQGHIIGVLYDPHEQCAHVNTERACIGDWIIEDPHGNLSICNGEKFASEYEVGTAGRG